METGRQIASKTGRQTTMERDRQLVTQPASQIYRQINKHGDSQTDGQPFSHR